jgi:hypothetical protein
LHLIIDIARRIIVCSPAAPPPDSPVVVDVAAAVSSVYKPNHIRIKQKQQIIIHFLQNKTFVYLEKTTMKTYTNNKNKHNKNLGHLYYALFKLFKKVAIKVCKLIWCRRHISKQKCG